MYFLSFFQFLGATSENFHLQMAGLNCLQIIISKFSKVAEPEFPGHLLLEQFQAQVNFTNFFFNFFISFIRGVKYIENKF